MLANISQFEALQAGANAGMVSQMSIFNESGTFEELLAIVKKYPGDSADDYLGMKNEIRASGKTWSRDELERAGFSRTDAVALEQDILERQ